MFSVSLRGLRCQKGEVYFVFLFVNRASYSLKDRPLDSVLSISFVKVPKSDCFVHCRFLNFSALKEAIRGARSICLNSGYNVS